MKRRFLPRFATARVGRCPQQDDPSARFRRGEPHDPSIDLRYHLRPGGSRAGSATSLAHGPLFNPAEIVLWNMHSQYLLELSARGLPVLPTQLVARGASQSLAAIKASRGWRDVVIKPAVSAGSRSCAAQRTRRPLAAHLADHQPRETRSSASPS